MRPLDTSPEAHAVQLEAYRAMGPEGRFRAACEMADLSRRLLAEGIRSRHPEYSPQQVDLALKRHWLSDDELFRKAYPGAPLLSP